MPHPPRKPPHPRPSKKERTRGELLRTGKDMLLQDGPESLTLRALAQRTGFSHTSLYYHFPDQTSFLQALRFELIEDIIRELTQDPVRHDDPVEDMCRLFWHYTDYFRLHRHAYRFLFQAAPVPTQTDPYTSAQQQLDEKMQSLWHEAFARLVSDGTVRPDAVEMTARTLIYAVQGMLTLQLSSNGPEEATHWRQELSVLVRFILGLPVIGPGKDAKHG